jgi:hypothetical protein
MSFNSSVQQLFVGLASVLAGFIVVKMPDNQNRTLRSYRLFQHCHHSVQHFYCDYANRKLKEKRLEPTIVKEELAALG